MLSGRTLHGVSPENWSWRKGLGFNLCVAPPHDRVVPNFGVAEFTEFTVVFRSTPEKTEKMERLAVCTNGCTMIDILLSYMTCLYMYPWEWMYLQNGKIIRQLWGIKKHNNQKWNITRSLEFGSEMSLRMENNRTEQENNKMMFPNEEGQDEWGTQ